MVLGLAEGEQFIASDIHALLPVTRRFIYLDEGDTAEIRVDRARVFDASGLAVERVVKVSDFRTDAVERGEYKHYMLKEIHEQPQAVADTLEGRIAEGRVLPGIFGPEAEALMARTRAVHLIACGSSYHACLVARYWIESLAGIPATVEIASEYRYRDAVVPADALFLTVSQSGETADTLAALRIAKQRGYLGSLALCNVPESSLVRESDLVLMTRAGPEIGVASTKAFLTQLTALALVGAGARPPSRRRSEALQRRRGAARAPPGRDHRGAGARPRTSGSSPSASRRRSTRCSSAAACSSPSPWKARSSSRRSRTSTPRPTRPASSSTARSRWSTRACR
jgi:glucosamine--fructose-6-phosphate aminotransferase (isomerizing)